MKIFKALLCLQHCDGTEKIVGYGGSTFSIIVFFGSLMSAGRSNGSALPNIAPERCIFQAAIMTAASLLQLHLQRDRIAQKSWARAQELLEGAPSTLSLGWMQEDF